MLAMGPATGSVVNRAPWSRAMTSDLPAPELDCLTCGVCCTGRPGTVLVAPEDLLRWVHTGRQDLVESLVDGHFSLQALPCDKQGRCSYQGTTDSWAACSIYEMRPSVCAAVPKGGEECLAYRRRGGRE
jgi:Fe-S-cluster containining protein